MLAEFTKVAREFYFMRRTKHRKGKRAKVPAGNAEMNVHNGTWVRIGSGYYGEAWMHSAFPDLVLKMSGPAFWGYDDQRGYEENARGDVWQAYAEHCMRHPHKNLPRIMHFERGSNSMAWAIMPKYTEWGYGIYEGAVGATRNALYAGVARADWMLPLIQMARMDHVQLDLHGHNIMEDPSTGEFILTDPFASTGGYKDPSEYASSTDRTYYPTLPRRLTCL